MIGSYSHSDRVGKAEVSFLTPAEDSSTPEPRFWMLFIPGNGAPAFRHMSYRSAHGEACRLARKFPKEKVYILEASQYVVTAEQPVELYTTTIIPTP